MTAHGIDALTAPGPLTFLGGPVWDLTDFVDTCRACDGKGFLWDPVHSEVCSVCSGEGLARECPDCEGLGDGDTDTCDTCDGLGQVP